MINSKDIKALRPDVALACNKLIEESKKNGIKIIITSTVRDDEYQALLYEQGRTSKGSIITNLKQPTFHWNKVGLAFDFCPVDDKGICLWSRADLFKKVAGIAKTMGFTWGGDWKGFVDMPHLQWDNKGASKNADVRALKLPIAMNIK